jgi:DNA repair protein RecN (Recombination protein N)
LNFQINEINSAKISSPDEEDLLLSKRNKLKESEKIIKLSTNVYKALMKNESGISAIYLIDKAIDALDKLSSIDVQNADLADKLREYKYEITDIAEKSADYASFEGVEDPEKDLIEIEARLTLIQKLKRKYGATLAEVIRFKNDAEEKLKNLEAGEERLAELKQEYKNIYKIALEQAQLLHNARVNGAKELSEKIKNSLEFLDMPKVLFEISVKKNESNSNLILSQYGFDDVEFMIATNVGEELSSMNKIASGGELSRIMLALKSIVSTKKGAQTVIFDEIDTGVSGSTSQKIGIKLCEIAKSAQTICVTHSAQIASLATTHFLIKKSEVNERAEARVYMLDTESRIKEIARIIGGIDVTDKQFAAANELIMQAKDLIQK